MAEILIPCEGGSVEVSCYRDAPGSWHAWVPTGPRQYGDRICVLLNSDPDAPAEQRWLATHRVSVADAVAQMPPVEAATRAKALAPFLQHHLAARSAAATAKAAEVNARTQIEQLLQTCGNAVRQHELLKELQAELLLPWPDVLYDRKRKDGLGRVVGVVTTPLCGLYVWTARRYNGTGSSSYQEESGYIKQSTESNKTCERQARELVDNALIQLGWDKAQVLP
jgi:hypothetical protein